MAWRTVWGLTRLSSQRRHGLGGFVRDPYDEAVNAMASDRAAVDVEEDRCFTGAVDPWSEQRAKDLGTCATRGPSR